MNSVKYRKSIRAVLAYTVLIATAVFCGCDSHKGFEKLESGIYKKLNGFGDCSPTLKDAEYFIMNVTYKKWNEPDSGYQFELHHGALTQTGAATGISKYPIGLRLSQQLDSMKCGDDITFILPFEEIDFTYLSAFADSTSYLLEQQMELRLHLKKTFTRLEYLNYLMASAQQNELAETDAIELFLMNQNEYPYEKSGDCFIQRIKSTQGDSIKAGREITIEYTTHLLNEKQLDSATTMQFPFGRPEQLIGGLHYGLSLMREGEQARIYLPSYLAFGKKGSSTGIVPPNTPVFFEVKVIEVKAQEEFIKKTKHI